MDHYSLLNKKRDQELEWRNQILHYVFQQEGKPNIKGTKVPECSSFSGKCTFVDSFSLPSSVRKFYVVFHVYLWCLVGFLEVLFFFFYVYSP